MNKSGKDPTGVKDNSNIFDPQGDRETPAKPPESDNYMEVEELPGNQCDDILDAENVHLPPEEDMQIPEDVQNNRHSTRNHKRPDRLGDTIFIIFIVSLLLACRS